MLTACVSFFSDKALPRGGVEEAKVFKDFVSFALFMPPQQWMRDTNHSPVIRDSNFEMDTGFPRHQACVESLSFAIFFARYKIQLFSLAGESIGVGKNPKVAQDAQEVGEILSG